ncbi:MAG TPA: response regulator transcription factor [Gaiellaceae bacterium]|jgi:DNA-binding NarL/FixJ family response regulator
MIRVAIADDQEMVRKGFRLLLEDEEDMEVVAEAGNGEEAVAAVRRDKPDVVLMDVRMPGLDGIEATRRLVEAGSAARVLVLTTFDLDEYVYEALRAGASGFLLKDAPAEKLVEAVRVVAAGESLLAPSVARRVVEHYTSQPRPRPELQAALGDLTDRELQVLRLVARGRSNAEIARELVVSDHTAKTHVGHVLSKLRLRDRIQAVVFAYESGLVRPGEAAEAGTLGA